MKNSMNKKLVAIVAVIALAAILAVCLVACNNQSTFEKRMKDKGYVVVSMPAEQIEGSLGEDIGEVEWAIVATKGDMMSGEGEYVTIVKFKSEKDAKSCLGEVLEELGETEEFTATRDGKILIVGSAQAVNDAKK